MREAQWDCAVAADPRRIPSKELVHKLNADEVLLTGWWPQGPGGFLITASWPRGHAYYAPLHGTLDPLLVAETIRQAGLLVSHAGLGVPTGSHFIWESLEFTLSAAALRARDGVHDSTVYDNTVYDNTAHDSTVEVRAEVLDAVRRGSQVKRLELGFALYRQATALATGAVRFSVQDPRVYQRVRGTARGAASAVARALPAPPPIPAYLAGRLRQEDVVLSAAGADSGARMLWRLRLDTAHPILFDHPVDHVPGIVLVDAARQAAQAFHYPAAAVVTAMRCEFNRYVELDLPCLVEITPVPGDLLPGSRLRARFRQCGSGPAGSSDPSGTVEITLAPVRSPAADAVSALILSPS